MGVKENITKKVKDIMDATFTTEEVEYVPDISDSKLTFGNKGLKFEATVLYIDLRGSTRILNNHNKATVAKVHMAYFHTVIKIATFLDGEVRSFNGDSMLVFFQGTTQETLSNAVRAAMMMKYMIKNEASGINKYLSKYTEIDFGIGLDDGKILCTKIGVGGDSNNKDLIWIGNSVNKSTVLSDKAESPNEIWISRYVYNNLDDDAKYVEVEGFFGRTVKKDIWTETTFEYNDAFENCYYTTYHMEL